MCHRYTSGVTILVANTDLKMKFHKSIRQTGHFYRTLWIITTRVPDDTTGERRLAMKLSTDERMKVKLLKTFSKNEVKQRKVKLFKTHFNVLCNSTKNLSSLLEIKVSTVKWHASRLFAAKELFSPVLGDNYYGPMIAKFMGSWAAIVNPDVVPRLAILEPELLELLKVPKRMQEIIPIHSHVRSLHLPFFLKGQDYIQAPLLNPFKWTYEQLGFKSTQSIAEYDSIESKKALG